MSDQSSTAVMDGNTDPGLSETQGPGLAWLLAGLMAAAGAIHFAMAPGHSVEGDGVVGLLEPLGFVIAGWFQFGIAAVILAGRGNRTTWMAAMVGSVALIGLWLMSRTIGLPIGAEAFEAEAVGGVDLFTVVMQAGAAITASILMVAPRSIRLSPVAAGLAVLALMGAATVAMVSPAAAEKHDGGSEVDEDTDMPAD
jgi:hypothetical protein